MVPLKPWGWDLLGASSSTWLCAPGQYSWNTCSALPGVSSAACCRCLTRLCGGTLHRAADVVLLCAVKLVRLHGEGTIAGNLRLARVRMLCPISGQSLTRTPSRVLASRQVAHRKRVLRRVDGSA